MKNLTSLVVLLLLSSLACMESASVVAAVPPQMTVTAVPTMITPPETAVGSEPDVGGVFMITLSGFEPYRVRVTSDGLNVRLVPSEFAVIDRVLAKGDEVTVYAVSSNGWGRISPDGASAAVWINLDYVEVMP